MDCDAAAIVWVGLVSGKRLHTAAYCRPHAEAHGIFDPRGYALIGHAEGVEPDACKADKLESFRCEACGMAQRRFEKVGRFGCEKCYVTFKGGLKPLLRKIHFGGRHYGKIPGKWTSEDLLNFRIKRLETKLRKAVADEDFEDAARFRDRIREMEGQGTDGGLG